MFGRRKKHQIRIRSQRSPKSKNKFRFYLILLILIGFGVFIFNKNPKEAPPEIQEEVVEKPALTDKEIQKQIQEDYKTNLLKHRMSEDLIRHKKNKYISKEKSAESEDYTLKDGVHLSQDESFDNLLSILKEAEETEEETDADIEDRIAHYRIIEKKIQNFQGRSEDNTQNNKDSIDPRKTFAQEFIENARKGGYEVKLDDNFKVKSVKKIKPDL